MKLGSSSTRKLVEDYDSVASSISSTRKLVADHETVVEESVSREKRDRDLDRVCMSERQGTKLHVYLEQKAESAVRGEKSVQDRLSEAEAEMETRIWEKRNADIALYDTHQELELTATTGESMG